MCTYSKINVYNIKKKQLVYTYNHPFQLVYGKDYFDIFDVVNTNPIEASDSPIYSNPKDVNDLCVECLDEIVEEKIVDDCSSVDDTSVIMILPPDDPHVEHITVYLLDKPYNSFDDVYVHDSQTDFKVSKDGKIVAKYTKRGKKGFAYTAP